MTGESAHDVTSFDRMFPAGTYLVAASAGVSYQNRYAPTDAPYYIGPSYYSVAAAPSANMAYRLASDDTLFGLRIHTVPEPTTYCAFLVCVLGFAIWRKLACKLS